MDWEKDVIRRMMEGAGDQTGAQLQFLLHRLEAYPDALPAIADAIEDMAAFHEQQAEALRAEMLRRNGGAEITTIQK